MKNTSERAIASVLGRSPAVKILDHFADYAGFAYNITEIAEGAGVSYASVKKIVPKLVECQLLVYAGREGKAKKYKTNTKSKAMQAFIKFDTLLTDQEWKRCLKEESPSVNVQRRSISTVLKQALEEPMKA